MRNWRGIGHRYAPVGLPGQARNLQHPSLKCAMLSVTPFRYRASSTLSIEGQIDFAAVSTVRTYLHDICTTATRASGGMRIAAKAGIQTARKVNEPFRLREKVRLTLPRRT